MKKKLTIIFPVVFVIAFGVFLLTNINMKDTDSLNDRLVLTSNKSVDVPEKASFAGEKIETARYDIHERFDRELNGFTYLHSTTMLYIKRANRIFPVIEPILKQNGIPDDFKYLAVIESGLDNRAFSPAKAVGLWQFMPQTAKDYGLEVTNQVDERYNLEKATQAFCAYMKDAYAKYGSWITVALSYNAGQNRISSELGNQQASAGLDLLLNDETSRYFFRMLAAKQIFSAPAKYGFVLSANQLYRPIVCDTIRVTQTIDNLTQFAKSKNLTYAQLKDFNTWMRDRKLVVKPNTAGYVVKIPHTEDFYYNNKKKTYVHNPNWIKHD